MTAAERKRMVEVRVASSIGWRIIHWLGSLRLALLLLATIAIACAAATIAESEFSTKIAQVYIYKAPWFLVWLGVLCVNLFAVTLTRWPWERKHTGFIVTHYGIILLLAGAMVGLHTGFEGNVTLHKNKPPERKITVNRSIIQVESPGDTALYVMPFDAAATRPSPGKNRVFEVPKTDLRIVADDFSDNLIKEESLVPSDSGTAGILLRLSSARLNQTVDFPMVLAPGQALEKDFFGLARLTFQSVLPAPKPPGGTETQMVFGRFAPVVQQAEKPSGVSVSLSADGSKVVISSDSDLAATYLREEIFKKPVSLAGAVVTVEEYWPDFEMREGKPATKSADPLNPAMLVRIQTPLESGGLPQLALAPAQGGARWQLQGSDGGTLASGLAVPGKSFATGWADWLAEVVESLPQSAVRTTVVPGPPLEKGETGVPGFRARLVSPETPDALPRWVPSGEVTALTDGRNVVRVGYGLELRPVPFTMRLLDFEVPRYEGTETPSNFIATIEFRNSATGETQTGTARMNHPAGFPGTLWANLTGINYKFSQAEWNPKDLGETTLQVLYDPGWLLKWFGSLAICAGIAIMFYLKPKTRSA